MSKAKCPECGSGTGVTYTYYPKVPRDVLVARTRRCGSCGARFTTYEVTKEYHDDLVGLADAMHGLAGAMARLAFREPPEGP